MFILPWKKSLRYFQKNVVARRANQQTKYPYKLPKNTSMWFANFLSMYFVYGLKTLKTCLAICSSNITLKALYGFLYGSLCINKKRSYRDKIILITIRSVCHRYRLYLFNYEHLLDSYDNLLVSFVTVPLIYGMI